jgi:hypothetical protein
LNLIQATKKHLLSCGWKIKQDCNGIFFVSQENEVIRELMEACFIQMAMRQETNVKELKVDQESHSRPGKASVLIMLPLKGMYDAESFERYITTTPLSSSSLDLIQTTKKHLVSCGWQIKEGPNRVLPIVT